MPPASRRVRLPGGLESHLLEWGGDDPGRRHTVLMLHGFLENAWAWEETVEAGLAGRYHVVCVDLRGHGDSERVGAGAGYHLADYVADLDELVPQVARETFSLVGHSLGGVIAGFYACACPRPVSRLVLMEGTGLPHPSPGGPPRLVRWLSERQRVRERPQRSYATLEEAAARLAESDPALRPALARRLAEKGTARGPDGRLRFKHDPRLAGGRPCVFDPDYAMRYWAEVSCPVLLLEGEHSPIRLPPEEASRRWSAFRDRHSALVPAAGHMMQRDQPAALARLLVRFLDDGRLDGDGADGGAGQR
jgi:pimeloyl-ACP methyl ester carboxylesterase